MTVEILDRKFEPFISRENIEERISALAASIAQDYRGKCPVFVVVLNGAFLFASELVKRIPLSCEINFIRVASYAGTESTGKVKEILGLDGSLKDKDVIVVEDIVDTGLTMHMLLTQLREQQPSSIEVASLLHKPEALQTPIDMRYLGFEIENRFVVGYGLDYEGIGRNLDALYVSQ